MKLKFEFETIDDNHQRAKVIGGWLVKATEDCFVSLHEDSRPETGYQWTASIAFVPDPKHEWEIDKL